MKKLVSVIIPTQNEEKWLPRLLNSLQNNMTVKEIIVADHNSLDGTRGYAANFGCKLIKGGRPATGRNNGAQIANGEILAFIDSDVFLPANIIDTAQHLFIQNSQLSCLHFRLKPLTKNIWIRFCYSCLDRYIQLTSLLGVQQGVAGLVFIRREAFNTSGGYDEDIEVGEDVEFLRRAGRYGKTLYLRNQFVFISSRRFAKDGNFLFSAKALYWGIFHLLGKRENLIPYDWSAHDDTVFLLEEEFINNMIKAVPKEVKKTEQDSPRHSPYAK